MMEKNLPKVNDEQWIGNVGEIEVQRIFIKYFRWLAAKIKDDVGEDIVGTVVEENFVQSQYHFRCQVKSTSEEAEAKRIKSGFSCPIKTSTLNSWQKQPMPVFLIVYDERSDKCYWAYPDDQIAGEDLSKLGTKNIRVDEKNIFDTTAKNVFFQEIRRYYVNLPKILEDADRYLELYQPAAALDVLEKPATIFPDLRDEDKFGVESRRARAHWQQNEIDKAIECYQRAYEYEKESARGLSVLALIRYLEGKQEEAKEHALEALAKGPVTAFVLCTWIDACANDISLSDIENKIEAYEVEKDISILTHLAMLAGKENQLDLAEQYARQGLAIDEKIAIFYAIIAEVKHVKFAQKIATEKSPLQHYSETSKEIMAILDEAKEKSHNHLYEERKANFLLFRGWALNLVGDREEAKKCFAKAYSADENSYIIAYEYGISLLNSGELRECYDVLASIPAASRDLQVACHLARVAYDLDDNAVAKETIKELAKDNYSKEEHFDGHWYTLIYHYASLLRKIESLDKAIEYLDATKL